METHEAISTLLGYTLKEDKNPPAEVINAIGHIIRLEAKKEVVKNEWENLHEPTEEQMAAMRKEKEIEIYRKEFADVRDAILHYGTYSQIINPKWIEQYNKTLEKIQELEGGNE